MDEISGISLDDPPSRSREAYSRIKRMVLAGKFSPGQSLPKREIAAMLKMSPTPVIEAFHRLEQEGLLVVVPHGGARVRAWTVDEIAEGLEIRAALEGLIAGRCAEVADADRLAELRPLAEKVDRDDAAFCNIDKPPAIQPGMMNSDDWRFHRMLAELSRFARVTREIERLQLLQLTCRMFAFPCEPQITSHVQILDAIIAGEGKTAEEMMRAHVRSSAYVLPRLRAKFGNGPVIFNALSEETPRG